MPNTERTVALLQMLCDRSSAGYNKHACVKSELKNNGGNFVHPALHNFASVCKKDFSCAYAHCVVSAQSIVDITSCDEYLQYIEKNDTD